MLEEGGDEDGGLMTTFRVLTSKPRKFRVTEHLDDSMSSTMPPSPDRVISSSSSSSSRRLVTKTFATGK